MQIRFLNVMAVLAQLYGSECWVPRGMQQDWIECITKIYEVPYTLFDFS